MKNSNSFLRLLTDNYPIKLLSVAIAFILWIVIVNIENPIQSRNFTTSVTVTNESVLTAAGKYYTIPEGANTVTFKVSAPRKTIERLSSDSFIAVADMNNLEDDARVPVEISLKNYSNSITISARQQYLNVNIGSTISRDFIINAVAQGDPANGFVVDSISAEPHILTVTGPDRVIASINKVVARVDISGASTNTSYQTVPVLLNNIDEQVDTAKVTLSSTTVNVLVNFTNTKSVPIILESQMDPEAEYDIENPIEVQSVTITPERIDIVGDSTIINDMTEIIIPTTVVDLSTITADVETTVDINRYLPEGVRLLDGAAAEVKVEIKVSRENHSSVEVPTSNISIRNIAPGLRARIDTETMAVSISGRPSVLSGISGTDITGTVDVSGLGEGTHIVRVEFDPDERFSTSVSTVTVSVVLY